ncbi:MAG TPA: hypothetical protein VMF89_09410, partial [Polyangiales bacterium]|nr:hypothetical protein [Polyangiales bacterium]
MTPPPTASPHALHVSACAAERRERAAAFLRSLPRAAPALIIVPNPNAGLWLMQDVLSPGDARFEWRRISLEQQCRALARPTLLQAGKSSLSPVAAQALSTRVMLDLAARAELGRFAAVSSQPGFGRALWNTLSELRLARVTPDMLALHDPDLARIAAAFEAALEERSLVDLAALYELAAARARGVRVPALLLFDVAITHAAEAELVRAIALLCEHACATVPLGDTHSLEALRTALPRASEQTVAPRAAGELSRLQAHLFERDLSKNIPAPGSIDTSQVAFEPEEARPNPSPKVRKRAAQRSAPGQGDLFAAFDTGPGGAQRSLVPQNTANAHKATATSSHDGIERVAATSGAASAAAATKAAADAITGLSSATAAQEAAANGGAASERTAAKIAHDVAGAQGAAATSTTAYDHAAAAKAGAAIAERGSAAAGAQGAAATSGAATERAAARAGAEVTGAPGAAGDCGASADHSASGSASGAASGGLGGAALGRDQRVHFVSSPGESRECVEVARAVLDAARSGVAFDRMAVLVRAVDNYRSFVEEALERAAIPAHYAAGVRRPAPEGRAFALLLRCADSGLSVRRFAEYLSLGVMPRAEQTEGAVVSPRYWERLLLQAQVGNQSAHWARQLDHLGTRWREELQLLAADDAERDARQKRIDALQSLKDFALPLLAAIEALPERTTFDRYRDQLSVLAMLALDKPGEVQTLLAELSPLDHAELGRRELVQLLSPHLHSLIVPSEGNGAGKVQVLPVEEARGRSFERVFVVGLAEKLMPPRLREDPLLPDEVRARVSPALARMPERVANERLALRIAVAAAREHLHLSFPRFDAEQGR